MIKNGDVSAAVYMFVQQILKILAENHITWCDDDIFLQHTLNNAQVRGKCRDIGIVDVVQFAVLIEQKLQLAVLKVDIEVCAVAQMLGKRAGILSYINLNTVDFTVCEIGECEIDQPVSSKEGESAQRAVVLQPLDIEIAAGRDYDCKRFIHLILPPLQLFRQERHARQAEYADCQESRRQLLHRSLRRRKRALS